MKVAIIGNSIVSNLAVMYFKKNLPEGTELVLIGPDDRSGLPLVGESIIENTTHFMENLGLAQYLRKNHYPKFGLTYYFKLDPNNPEDRTYSVHCNERTPDDLPPLEGWDGPEMRPPSWLLNRETFDRDIMAMAREHEDVEFVSGLVKDVDLDGDGGHTLHVEETNGNSRTIEADWVIDVTGRKQLLARKMDMVIKPEEQRDCFWFRLKNFDRSLLKELNALGPMPQPEGERFHYDRYYTTHHFMGHGNWIWMIPIRAEDGSELISIGFVSRPDIYEGEVNSMESFLEQVSQTHPVVSDFVKSGEVVDTNLLKRYHYVVNRVYSPDRWAIVGDAAFAPDPLFSNGLAFCTIQLEQLGEMIRQDIAGKHSPEFVNALSDAFLAPVLAAQMAIAHWYPDMEDSYLSSLRLTWIEIAYFYMVLPLVVNRCHYDPERVGLWSILQNRPAESAFDIAKELLEARAKFDQPTPEHFLYIGREKVNPEGLKKFDNIEDIKMQVVKGGKLREDYIKKVVARVNELAGLETA